MLRSTLLRHLRPYLNPARSPQACTEADGFGFETPQAHRGPDSALPDPARSGAPHCGHYGVMQSPLQRLPLRTGLHAKPATGSRNGLRPACGRRPRRFPNCASLWRRTAPPSSVAFVCGARDSRGDQAGGDHQWDSPGEAHCRARQIEPVAAPSGILRGGRPDRLNACPTAQAA